MGKQFKPKGKQSKKKKVKTTAPRPRPMYRQGESAFPQRSGVPKQIRSKPPPNTTVSLQQCTIRYAVAVADPFNAKARGACIPVDNGSSMKATGFVRLDITSATTGGLIYCMPSVASDMPAFFYTDSTWVGTTCPFATVGNTGAASTLNVGWNAGYVALPFSAGQCIGPGITGNLANGVTSKIVSAGIRLSYTGTELNKGGVIYCYHDPAHATVAQVNASNIGSLADSTVDDVSRMPCTLSMYGTLPQENNFAMTDFTINSVNQIENLLLYPYGGRNTTGWVNNLGAVAAVFAPVFPNSASLLTGGNPSMGAPISVISYTSAGVSSSFHLEYTVHAEYQGKPAASMLTPNAADPDGVAMVKSAAARLPSAKNTKEHMTPMAHMSEALADVAKAAMPTVLKVGGQLLEKGAKFLLDAIL